MPKAGNAIRLVLVGAALVLFASPPAFSQTANPDGTTQAPAGAAGGTSQTAETKQAQDEKSRLAVNPLTGQTSAEGSDYTPLTADERWQLYLKQSFWSVGAYTGPFFAALALDQATGTPKQWGGGFAGYGRRVASRVASGDIVQNAFQFPVAALLKEDVRYITSNQHGFKRRAEHAIIFTFVTYNNQGRTILNVANIGGYYFAAGVSTLWLPGHQNVASYTLSNGSESIALGVPVNLIQEFWPEIRRYVFRRK